MRIMCRYAYGETKGGCGCRKEMSERREDLTGRVYGLLHVAGPAEPKNSRRCWRCVCDCGKEKIVQERLLLSGSTKSCGCLKSPDRTGQRFGSLVIVGRSDKRGKRGSRTVPLWECRCDCGATVYRAMDSLTTYKNCACEQCLNQSKTEHMRKYAGFYDRTQISRISNMKPTAASTSGVRGVTFDRHNGCWVARLTFRRKVYHLGSYKNMEDAVKARKRGEEIYEDFLDWYYTEYPEEQKESKTQQDTPVSYGRQTC